ncbi:MAG: BNR repeat-containing protein [Armatimonadota bacterium]|nr:BNR repeat-containing protein [Armatimonadota bacterium]
MISNNSIIYIQAVLILVLAFSTSSGKSAQVKETCIEIAPVWSGHPVGFSLLSCPERQYVAFYNPDRQLTVGCRKYSETTWHFVKLPETVGWDSHNYITMAMDDNGCIHLCANMHCSPLVYFRTTKPGDIDSFERIPSMVGRDETKCTYPSFFRGPRGEFLFTYRFGSSGNGDQYFNIYDHKTKTWKRLMDAPLTSGEGKMNAYFTGLRLYEDGYYHTAWVWRDEPDCSTNHDLSYARSKDLIHWETSDGKALKLPITLSTAEIVDPVPVKGGLLNGGVAIGLDSKKRLVISYLKFDEHGYNQVYNARREANGWKIYKTSSWEYRWEFSGTGSIPFEIRIGPIVVEKDGKLSQSYSHVKYGNGKWILDEENFRILEDIRATPVPKSDTSKDSTRMLEPRYANDLGSSGERGVRYQLRWETLSLNRDRPRDYHPSPSMLKLCRIESVPIDK